LNKSKEEKNLSLEENYKMDYRLAQRFAQGSEFYEGIRTVLVDKKDKPKWIHKSIKDVKEGEVEEYFKPLKDVPELKLE